MSVNDEDGLMIICKSGMTIRMAVDKLRVMGRATQGVRLINIKDKDAIASIAKTPKEDEEEENEFIEGITDEANIDNTSEGNVDNNETTVNSENNE
jgi:DNA gyrase subunit A